MEHRPRPLDNSSVAHLDGEEVDVGVAAPFAGSSSSGDDSGGACLEEGAGARPGDKEDNFGVDAPVVGRSPSGVGFGAARLDPVMVDSPVDRPSVSLSDASEYENNNNSIVLAPSTPVQD